jgi:hypothetical protein
MFLLTVILLSFSCKAQQIYPLNTDFRTIQNNVYLKDINNELLPYIGIWKAAENNNEIIINVEKVDYHFIKLGNQTYYQDVLFIRYSIKNSQGAIIKSTMNLPITAAKITSDMMFPNQLLSFTYLGGDCGFGWGDISLKLVDAIHVKWNYRPDDIILTNLNCPNGADTTIYLSQTKDLVFTKQ